MKVLYDGKVISFNLPKDILLQSKSVSPSTVQQVVRADSGYDALSSVTISPVSGTVPTVVRSNGTYDTGTYRYIVVDIANDVIVKVDEPLTQNRKYAASEFNAAGISEFTVAVPLNLEEGTHFAVTKQQQFIEAPTGKNGYKNFYIDAPPLTHAIRTFVSNTSGYIRLAPGSSYIGYEYVLIEIAVPKTINLKNETFTKNGSYAVPTNYDGYGQVTVAVPDATLITKTITENGTYSAEDNNADGYSEVTVNVPQTKLKQLIEGTITDITDEDLSELAQVRDYAFYKCKPVNGFSITLPSSIAKSVVSIALSIGTSAFADSNLRKIKILGDDNSLTAILIGYGAFKNCTQLHTVDLGNKVHKLWNASNPQLHETFANTTAHEITNFVIRFADDPVSPDDLDQPGHYGVFDNTTITNLYVPDVTLGEGVVWPFGGNTYLDWYKHYWADIHGIVTNRDNVRLLSAYIE